MTNEIMSRRNFGKMAKAGGLTALAFSLGCGPEIKKKDVRQTLQSNTYNTFREGNVSLNEDKINMQKIGILEEWYFAMPLNQSNGTLLGGEPSFALIPESKSRTSISRVGNPGGYIIVDAPKGDLYFPYAVFKDLTGKARIEYPKELGQLSHLVLTSLQMQTYQNPPSNQGKIDLGYLTENNIPFSDETLQTINNQRYVVNKMEDQRTSFSGKEDNILPIYLTKLPLTVIQDRTKEDGNFRVRGQTYIFMKGENEKEYIGKRGINNQQGAMLETNL